MRARRPVLDTPATESIVLTAAQISELRWLRGGIHGIAMALRAVDIALAQGVIQSKDLGFDTAGVMWLVEQVTESDVLNVLVDHFDPSPGGVA